jgi:hypothetical protein
MKKLVLALVFACSSILVQAQEVKKEEVKVAQQKPNKNKKVEFEVIFFAHNLEHVIDENSNKLTDEEKEQIASDFAVESLNDRNYFIKTFTTSLMTWDSFKESYKGIKSYKDRACNINNLLNEIEEWKKN